jgi:hypothetical protein
MEKNASKSLKERKPGQHIKNPTTLDKDGHEVKVCDIANAWRVVREHNGQSLKQFARAIAESGDEHARRWLHNKRVNTKKPGLGIGCTRKKKGNKN